MKKELRTQFLTRQHMVSKDFEIYYYSDTTLLKVENHAHNYYEFYFFWKVMSVSRLVLIFIQFNLVTLC